MKLRIAVVVAAGVASLTSVGPEPPVAHAAQAVPETILIAPAPDTTVVESVDLAGNMQLRRTALGSLVIGPPTTKLIVVEGPAGPQLGLEIPDPAIDPTQGWTADQAAAVLSRAASGETFARLQQEFPPGAIAAAAAPDYENGACLQGSAAQEKYGFIQSCSTRKKLSENATYRWVSSSSWTYAQSNQNNLRVADVHNKDTYKSDVQIVDWTPKSVIKNSSCTSYGISLSFANQSVSMSKNVCPTEMFPTRRSGAQNGLEVTWKGQETRATTEQIEVARGAASTGVPLVQAGSANLKAKCPLGPLCSLPPFWG
jgi:hypothetical protein